MSRIILVSGSARGGTTWLAAVVAAADDTVLADEPAFPHLHNKLQNTPAKLAVMALGNSAYYYPLNPKSYQKWFINQLRQFTAELLYQYYGPDLPENIVIKVPDVGLLPLMLKTYEPDILLIIRRHPLGVYNSRYIGRGRLRYSSWGFNTLPRLVSSWCTLDYSGYLQYLHSVSVTPLFAMIGIVALEDKLIKTIQHPKELIINYENLCLQPYDEFPKIYDFCGLEWDSERVKDYISPDVDETGFHSVRKKCAPRAFAWKTEMLEEERVVGCNYIKQLGLPYACDDSTP